MFFNVDVATGVLISGFWSGLACIVGSHKLVEGGLRGGLDGIMERNKHLSSMPLFFWCTCILSTDVQRKNNDIAL